MPYETIDQLPSEVQEKLPKGAQNIFMAALNSATRDGISEQEAIQVAWNSVRNEYQEGKDGQWEHRPEGGTGTDNAGAMGAA